MLSSDPVLLDAAYAELRRVASAWVRRHRVGNVSPTSLVHEAWMRVAQRNDFKDQSHFRAVAALAIRHVLVDLARAAARTKRGGGLERVTLSNLGTAPASFDILALDAALRELEVAEPRLARVVDLRFFGGHTHEEIAVVLAVNTRTVESDWRKARAWLLSSVQGQDG